MKKITLSILSACLAMSSYGQKENKFIREEDVVRIIKTLSADDMKGRPASEPQYIEKATQFIEKEFSEINSTLSHARK